MQEIAGSEQAGMVRYTTIRIDEDAYKILVEIKNLMKRSGISASFSDAIRFLRQEANIE